MPGFGRGASLGDLVHPAPTQRVQDQATDRDALLGVLVFESLLFLVSDALAEVADTAADDQPGELGVHILDIFPLQATSVDLPEPAGAETSVTLSCAPWFRR